MAMRAMSSLRQSTCRTTGVSSARPVTIRPSCAVQALAIARAGSLSATPVSITATAAASGGNGIRAVSASSCSLWASRAAPCSGAWAPMPGAPAVGLRRLGVLSRHLTQRSAVPAGEGERCNQGCNQPHGAGGPGSNAGNHLGCVRSRATLVRQQRSAVERLVRVNSRKGGVWLLPGLRSQVVLPTCRGETWSPFPPMLGDCQAGAFAHTLCELHERHSTCYGAPLPCYHLKQSNWHHPLPPFGAAPTTPRHSATAPTAFRYARASHPPPTCCPCPSSAYRLHRRPHRRLRCLHRPLLLRPPASGPRPRRRPRAARQRIQAAPSRDSRHRGRALAALAVVLPGPQAGEVP